MKYDSCMVGTVIRKLREARGLTREELGEKAGISVHTVHRLESGERNLTMNTLYSIMEALDCDANTILNTQGQKEVLSQINMELGKIPLKQREEVKKIILELVKYINRSEDVGWQRK